MAYERRIFSSMYSNRYHDTVLPFLHNTTKPPHTLSVAQIQCLNFYHKLLSEHRGERILSDISSMHGPIYRTE